LVFKLFKDYFRKNSINLPEYDVNGRPLGSHEKVIYYIENNINRHIGRVLRRLKSYRIKADYKSGENLTRRDAENSIRLARIVYQFFIEEFNLVSER